MPEPIEELFVSIRSDVKDLVEGVESGVDKAESRLKRFEKAGKNAFSKIGSFAQKAAGVFAAVSAAVTAIVIAINKATDAAVENERAFANLASSAAAANREFGNSVGTVESWERTVKDVGKELKVFSDRDLAVASARLVDMTKRLGLTEDEMATVLRRTGDLAAGKTDLTGAIERTSAALRGEAESAEFLGLSLNENAVKSYAEAQGKVWKDLSDTEKARERYQLFLKQTNQLQGRAARFAQTRAGQEDVLNAKLERQASILGEQLTPLREGYVEALSLVADESEDSAGIVTNALAGIAAVAGTVVLAIEAMATKVTANFKLLSDVATALKNFEDPTAAAQAGLAEYNKEVEGANAILGDLPGIAQQAFRDIKVGWAEQRDAAKEAAAEFGDAGESAAPGPGLGTGALAGEADAQEQILRDAQNELLDLQKETQQKQQESAIEHAHTMTDIIKDSQEERVTAAQELNDALADLEKDAQSKREDILADTRDAIARAEEESDKALADARQEFNTDERRETEDHLRDMRRLRNQFSQDLEEAVKNRDARAVVDLQRRFQQEQQERTTDFETKQTRQREDQDRRLQQIREAEAEAVRIATERQQEALNKLAEAEQEKRQKLRESYDAQIAKIDEAERQKLQTESESYQTRQEQLKNALAIRLEEIATELGKEEEINRTAAENILTTLAEYFGESGSILKLLDRFEERASRRIEIDVDFEERRTEAAFAPTLGGPPIPSFQHGGAGIATRPTLISLAEAGSPEAFQIAPLRQISQMERSVTNTDIQRMELDVNIRGDATGLGPDIKNQLAGVLVTALREAGLRNKSSR